MTILFENARIIDGLGNVIPKGWILIVKDRIADVGPAGVPPPLEAGESRHFTRESLHGETIIPGLIDVHVHLDHDASADPQGRLVRDPAPLNAIKATVHAMRTLHGGLTTVRDMGSKDGMVLHVRNAVEVGLIPGPRILAAGAMICMTGGHGWRIGMEADGPEAVRKAVRHQIKQGADVIKFMATGGVLTQGTEPGSPQLDRKELEAGIAEAQRSSRKTAAHAQGPEGIRDAVLAGIDSIEHGIGLNDEIIDRMLNQGTVLVPTLSAPLNILAHGIAAGIPPFVVEKTKKVLDMHIESLHKAKERGVAIAMGTDAGTPFNRHGENARELMFMVENGFSEMEALISATSAAARLLGMEHEIGSIEKGATADLLILRKNPVNYISSLREKGNLVSVFKAGKKCFSAS